MDNDRLDGLSMNMEKTEREKLMEVFPECFVEGKLNIDKLLTMCGEYMTNDYEKYEFTWKGKSDCMLLAQQRSTGTLRPCVEESVNFDTTQNLYIEGDNLETMKLLQSSFYRKVKVLYADCPYNTGNDFVYEDKFADNLSNYKEITSQMTRSNPETAGRYHTNWLNMMYPRLRLAKNLLTDDGVFFISIDDNEVHNLRKMCDEIFGEDNFVAQICHKARASVSNDKIISSNHNHILFYARNYNEIFNKRHLIGLDPNLEGFKMEDENGFYKLMPVDGPGGAKKGNPHYTFMGVEGYWRFSKETMQEKYDNGLVVKLANSLQQKYYLEQAKKSRKTDTTWWDENVLTSSATKDFITLMGGKYFDNPKNINLIIRMLKLFTNDCKDAIIMDFFSGSASTAHATMQLNAEDGGNRRFIMVQLPELCDEKSEAYKAGYKNICEIGKERIRRAGKKILESTEQIEVGEEKKPLDVGFRVFKLDTSNLKIWDNTPVGNDVTELENRLRGMLDVIKADRTNIDVVYEVMLKLGQDLCTDIIPIEINEKTVYGIGLECLFMVCLAENIDADFVEQIAEYSPGRIIFTDQCFANTTDKSNVKLACRNNGITMKML